MHQGKSNRQVFTSRNWSAVILLLTGVNLVRLSTACVGQPAVPTLQFATASFYAEEDSGTATITVLRAGDPSGAVTVRYATGKGLATADAEYKPQAGVLSFGIGETKRTFSIPIMDDSVPEGSETVALSLSSPTGGATLGTQATARLYIQDNEFRGTLLDTTFRGAIGPADTVSAIALQPDGKAIMAGSFARSAPAGVDRVIRLNQDGSRDRSFALQDGGPNNLVHAVVLQPDGKPLLGGEFTQVGLAERGRIARLHPDGSLDESFDPGLGVGGDLSPGVYILVLQRDGKILAGGNFSTVNGARRNNVARLESNGTVDATFDPGSGVISTDKNFQVAWVSGMALQPDGRLLISGQFTSVGDASHHNVARLNSDGSVDSAFNAGTGATGELASVEALALQPDGKVILGGDFSDVNGVHRNGLARLNADGSVDPSLEVGGGVMNVDADGVDVPGLVTSLAVQSDGKILFAGTFLTLDEINRHGIGRVNPDGSLDGTFGPYLGTTYRNPSGYEEFESVTALALRPDGTILTGATFVSADGVHTNRVTQLRQANERASSVEFESPIMSVGETTSPVTLTVIRRGDSREAFTTQYATTSGTATAGMDYTSQSGVLSFDPLQTKKTITIPVQSDWLVEDNETFEVVLSNPSKGTSLGAPGTVVVRIIDSLKTGNLDLSFSEVRIPFSPQAARFRPVNAILVQDDLKVLVAGYFGFVNETTRLGVVRLKADGTIDPGFDPEPPAGNEIVEFQQMGLQPDGGIVGGLRGLFRLRSDGSLDAKFLPVLNVAISLAVRKDGAIFVCDQFSDSNTGASMNEVLRLEASGSFDPTFLPAELDDWVNAMALQPDGKLVIGGYFSRLNGNPQNRIARLNTDGTLDSDFDVGRGLLGGVDAAVFALALQKDGKVLAAGFFNGINGVLRNNLARLNADGSVDATFDTGTGPDAFVEAVAVQSDGKILIGGSFTSVNGVRRLGLARLNADGSLDTGFAPSLTFPDGITVSAIAVQPDGQIVIGGLFTEVNGLRREGLARLNGGLRPLLRMEVGPIRPGGPFRMTLSTELGKRYQLQSSADLVNWTVLRTVTATGATTELEDPDATNQGLRFYRGVAMPP